MTMAQAVSDLQGRRLSQPVVVEDTQDNLQNNIGWLQKLAAAGKLSSISFTDGANSLQFSASQVNSSTALLNKAVASGITVQVADTAGNTARMASRISTAYEVTVTDTAANIQKNLAGLQTLAASGKLDTLTFTDSSEPIVMKASQFGNTAALRALMPDATINVVDTAANVAKTNVAGASHVTVKDTAANVLRNLDAMRTLASTSPVASRMITACPGFASAQVMAAKKPAAPPPMWCRAPTPRCAPRWPTTATPPWCPPWATCTPGTWPWCARPSRWATSRCPPSLSTACSLRRTKT